MRWEKVSATTDQEIYHLYQNDQKILSLTLHPFSQSARVETATEKRVILIRKEGFLRNKTVLRNEYGVKIGEWGQDQLRPFLQLNNERFFYKITNDPLAELQLFHEGKEQPLLRCGLTTKGGDPAIQLHRDNRSSAAENGLLMALCWYMFLPVARENVPEYA
ncbi:MAG: hypothetical protein IAE96_10410 [Chitinophagaceae bacterium]|nr:hypothetical protein [Chitinophagaceae bacterium]